MSANLALQSDQPLQEPLTGAELNRLRQAVATLSAPQLNWASGYLAGLGSSNLQPEQQTLNTPLTVLYASQTGNSRLLAEALCSAAETRGIKANLRSAEEYKVRQLAKEKVLLLIVSTHGEGEPPESAQALYDYLHGSRSPSLQDLKFSVFGLGDSSYEHFCQTARLFDQRLEALGGERLMPRVEADVDFQTPADGWIPAILQQVEPLQREHGDHLASISPIRPSVSRINRNHPFTATVVESRRITTADATADVRHLALQIDPGVVRYEPGDSVGVLFANDPRLIDEIVALAGLERGEQILLGETTLSLERALSKRLEVTQLHPKVVSGWAELSGIDLLLQLQQTPAALREYCSDRQLIDLITEHPAKVTAQQLVALLQPLQPRLYSIASSQREFEDEIHLTVAVQRYRAHGREHLGGASGYLGERLQEGAQVEIYVVSNKSFRLLADGSKPIIMIGAGTGIAPFRAFFQHRSATGETGPNWLIFGNRRFHRDFLYQREWLALRNAGQLQRTTLAFSREEERRAYVQDRILDEGETLFRWLQEGAHLYVCGATKMEEGVREALRSIVEHQAGLSSAAADEYIDRLRKEGRYQRDVY